MCTVKGNGVGRVLGLSVAAILGLTAVTDVQAQAGTILSYAAKFVCGPLGTDQDVVKGVYATTINIHNPQFMAIPFMKKAVVALAERSTTPGQISQKWPEQLAPDAAMGVDCRDIRELFVPPIPTTKHFEGFLVIEVPPTPQGAHLELDVVGKYTARHRTGAGGLADVTTDVESIDVVPYTGRLVSTTPTP
jgi:hypothetical protein